MSITLTKSSDVERQRERLEALRKDANDPTLTVGDFVFCGGIYSRVMGVYRYAPGAHPQSPIRNDYTAVQVLTDNGSRWHGVKTNGFNLN